MLELETQSVPKFMTCNNVSRIKTALSAIYFNSLTLSTRLCNADKNNLTKDKIKTETTLTE